MMRTLLMSALTFFAIACFMPQPASADPTDLLYVFVGEWEGTATALRPRDTTGRENRVESVVVSCDTTLKGSYVECNSFWTRVDSGQSRNLKIFWNYDKSAGKHEILFLYDNWPGKVSYQLDYDSTNRTFTGSDTFIGPGGVPAQERVEWRISEDGNTIYGTERNHYENEPKDFWPKSFEYVWRRKPKVGDS